MSVRNEIGRRRRALREEDGFAMVIAVFLIVIGLAVAAVAVTAALSARTSANRSQRSARALQAADAGLQTELYRVNQINFDTLNLSGGINLAGELSTLLTCPVPDVDASGEVIGLQFGAISSIGGACPTNSGSGVTNPGPNEEPVGDHDYFQAAFVPGTTSVGDFVQFDPKVVASGVDDNATASDPSRYVSRRVEAILAPVNPWHALEATHNLQIDVPPALSVLGTSLAGATVFNGTAAAGNNLTIDGHSTLLNTFTATGVSLSGGSTEQSALDYCGSYSDPNMTLALTLGSVTHVTSGCSSLVNRSPIQISPDKQDCVTSTGAESCGTDPGFGAAYAGGSQDEIYNTNAATTLTFGPGDYVFCSFQTDGPVDLNPSSAQAVRIFIDSPSSARCKNFVNHAGSLPAHFTAAPGNLIATRGEGNLLAATHPSQAQVYLAGNGTNDGTSVYSTGSSGLSGQAMFVYAPSSNVTVTAGQTCVLGGTVCTTAGALSGAFVGYDLDVGATAITQDLGLLNYPLSSSLGPFYVKQYIECPPAYPLPSPDPTAGC
jgi:hypothetical protein